MAIAQMDLLSSVDLIAKGIEAEYRALLEVKLTEVAREVAEQAAKNVVARVETYRSLRDQVTQVHVRFADVPTPA